MTTSSASYYFMLRYAIALALIAPFAASDRAEAACNPETSALNPVKDVTVTCTGTTIDQNKDQTTFNGYGSGGETGITVNVETDALVRATDKAGNGIVFSSATVNNSGTIEATGAQGVAINALNINAAGTATVNNFSTGRIEATGFGGVAIKADDTATVNNFSSGRISANADGAFDANGALTRSFAIRAVTVDVTGNAGTIEATGTFGVAISADGTATVNNSSSGRIEATGTRGIAISATDATVNNFTSGVISADFLAINATNVTVNDNAGTIEATGTNGSAIFALDATVSNLRSGTISANGEGGSPSRPRPSPSKATPAS